MDIAPAIVTGCLGAGGVIGFVQFLISRHDNQKSKLNAIEKQLNAIEKTQQETIIRVTRQDLKDLIRHDPDNVEAIMQVGGYYFVDLDGNAYMHAIFEKWAKEHEQPTNWLPKLKNERSRVCRTTLSTK